MNQENKGLFLAIALSLLVVFAWDALYMSKLRKKQAPASGAAPAASQEKAMSMPATPPAGPTARIVQSAAGRSREAEWEAVRAAFSADGGRLSRWELKDYHEHKTADLVALVKAGQDLPLWVGFEGNRSFEDSALNYRVASETSHAHSFAHQGKNVALEKTYDWKGGGYGLTLTVRLKNLSSEVLRGRLLLAWTQAAETTGRSQFEGQTQGIVLLGDSATKRGQSLEVSGQALRWAGVDLKYFLSAWIPQGVSAEAALVRHANAKDTLKALDGSLSLFSNGNSAKAVQSLDETLISFRASEFAGLLRQIPGFMWALESDWTALRSAMERGRPPEGIQEPAERLKKLLGKTALLSSLRMPVTELQKGDTATYRFRVFMGPKRTDILKAYDPTLEEAINFGWLAILARPMLLVLQFFYGLVHNYGLAIILLTLLVKVLFYPLTHRSMENMKKMQELNPEMARLREKYAKDPQRLNMEIMQLFKRHGTHPMMGCLPMLVQIPVWFALYRVLLEAIELRQAPFFFWISDLSDKDPFYVLPILMGISFVVQQKLTPTPDPQQAKMMMFMSVFFAFFMANFPSGLVIYIFMNNLMSIIQQRLVNRSVQRKQAIFQGGGNSGTA